MPSNLPTAGSPDVRMDAVRTLAAVLVLVSHVRALFFLEWDDVEHGVGAAAFYAVTHLGHAAVIVFFVLSGYWVGGAAIRQVRAGRFSWPDYLLRRLSRLWVVLVPALVLTWAVSTIGLARFANTDVYRGTPDYAGVLVPQVADHLGAGTALANLLFLQGASGPFGGSGTGVAEFGNNIPLWSLSYEFAYYLLLPLLLCACTATRRPVARVGCVVIAAGIAGLVGWSVLVLFLAWLVGAVLARWEPRMLDLVHRTRTRTVALRLVAALGTAAALGQQAMLTDGAPVADLLLAACTALGILALRPRIVTVRPPGRLVSGVAWYAKASYSLYVIHLPVLMLAAAAAMPSARDRWTPTPGSLAAFGAITVATLGVALLFAVATEFRTDRIRRWLQARILPPAAPTRSG